MPPSFAERALFPTPIPEPEGLPPGRERLRIAVVIPAYRARGSICGVIAGLGPRIERIYVVDDGCPDGTGEHVQASCPDPRVVVLKNPVNAGVGGAMVRGYRAALADGMDVIVKMDADGQMDPAMLPRLLAPLLARQADYAKGNRFAAQFQTWRRAHARMPRARLFGNSVLSFLHKAVSGYWHILDPANGYTAIHRAALESINLDELSQGYFFENDLLYQLSLVRAVVQDVPMPAVYSGEKSHLRLSRVLLEFPWLFARRLAARIFFQYFITDFNIASVKLVLGLLLFGWGSGFGAYRWLMATSGTANTAGTVMLSSLPIILGFQLLLSALTYDIGNVPRIPLCRFTDEEPGLGPEPGLGSEAGTELRGEPRTRRGE